MSNDTPFVDDIERSRAKSDVTADFYAKALEATKQFRAEYKERNEAIKAKDMPMERTADGLLPYEAILPMEQMDAFRGQVMDVHAAGEILSGVIGDERVNAAAGSALDNAGEALGRFFVEMAGKVGDDQKAVGLG